MSRCSYLVVLLGLLWPLTVAAESAVVTADRVRIRAHLAEVETALRARDVSHLAPELQAERKRNIERLHEYRVAGVFPHNTYVPGRTPVFIDAEDRACAVGHLIIDSGHEDAARRIASRENLARLPDMRSPEVATWLATSGLTAAEATRIQPSYSATFCGQNCPCDYEGSDETRPVCGADGETYLNECVARACGGQTEFTYGCCDTSDSVQHPDPAPAADAGTDAGDPNPFNEFCRALSGYCASDIAQPGPSHNADADDTDTEKSDTASGCAVVRSLTRTSSPPWFMLAAGFVVIGIRRRRDQARLHLSTRERP